MTPAYRHPPVEPALCHRGSPTVAGEGWGAQSRALAAVAGPGHPPDCVLAQGGPPLVSPPHHGEVTRPWAAVGVHCDMQPTQNPHTESTARCYMNNSVMTGNPQYYNAELTAQEHTNHSTMIHNPQHSDTQNTAQ